MTADAEQVRQAKQAIRARMRERADAFLATGAAGAESARILAAAEALPAFAAADCVLLYMALPDEVQTGLLLARWQGRKRLVIPRVDGQDLTLCEYDPARLRPGYRGIPEPTADARTVAPEDIGLALVPGVAFAVEAGPLSGDFPAARPCSCDGSVGLPEAARTDGAPLIGPWAADLLLQAAPMMPPHVGKVRRLGRGKGFYDRLLPQLRCPAIGICYPFRVLDAVPADPWDRPLDGLVY